MSIAGDTFTSIRPSIYSRYGFSSILRQREELLEASCPDPGPRTDSPSSQPSGVAGGSRVRGPREGIRLDLFPRAAQVSPEDEPVARPGPGLPAGPNSSKAASASVGSALFMIVTCGWNGWRSWGVSQRANVRARASRNETKARGLDRGHEPPADPLDAREGQGDRAAGPRAAVEQGPVDRLPSSPGSWWKRQRCAGTMFRSGGK